MCAGEVSGLDIGDIDTTRWVAKVIKTYSGGHGLPKSCHSRHEVELPVLVRAAVLHAIGGRTSGILFPRRDGGRVSQSRAQNRLRRLCKRLKIRYRKPHALRHAVLTALVNSGAPLGDVARHVGHSVAVLVKV